MEGASFSDSGIFDFWTKTAIFVPFTPAQVRIYKRGSYLKLPFQRASAARELVHAAPVSRRSGEEFEEINSYIITLREERNLPMNRYQELLDLIQTFQKDFEKFYVKGNKSAGTRVRKHMAALKRKAQEVRNEVQEIKQKMAGEEGEKPQA